MIILTKHDDLRYKQVRLSSSEIVIAYSTQRNVEMVLKSCLCQIHFSSWQIFTTPVNETPKESFD